MKKEIILIALVILTLSYSCSKKTSSINTISTGVSWTINSQTHIANNIQIDYQGLADGYYEIIATANSVDDSSELIIGISNGTIIGDHSVPNYWVYSSIYDKITNNKTPYVFENYTLNITSASGIYVSGNCTAVKNLGPTLTCNFTDIKSTP